MNNFCIAHASLSAIETFQERYLQELRAFILTNLFLCLFLVLEYNIFRWMENIFLCTHGVGAADICGVYVILTMRA